MTGSLIGISVSRPRIRADRYPLRKRADVGTKRAKGTGFRDAWSRGAVDRELFENDEIGRGVGRLRADAHARVKATENGKESRASKWNVLIALLNGTSDPNFALHNFGGCVLLSMVDAEGRGNRGGFRGGRT